jgi:chromosome transmission fidelity protein 1
VILPYNLLLSRVARESLGIDLQDHVVVIDEAHSQYARSGSTKYSLTRRIDLIDTILSIHTVALTSDTLKTCLSQLKVYLHRFRTRLTARHSLHLKQLVVFLVALSKVCQDFQGTEARRDTLLSPAQFSALLGSKGEGINLLEIESYLRRSHIARKISSYCDKQEEKDAAKGNPRFSSFPLV